MPSKKTQADQPQDQPTEQPQAARAEEPQPTPPAQAPDPAAKQAAETDPASAEPHAATSVTTAEEPGFLGANPQHVEVPASAHGTGLSERDAAEQQPPTRSEEETTAPAMGEAFDLEGNPVEQVGKQAATDTPVQAGTALEPSLPQAEPSPIRYGDERDETNPNLPADKGGAEPVG